MSCRSFLASLSASTLLLAASGAHAYCVQHTCEDAKRAAQNQPRCGRGEDGCVDEGYALNYLSPCFSFGVSPKLARDFDLETAELEDLLEEAFATWTTADCGGGQSPGLVVNNVGLVESDDAFFCKPVPELNLGVWVSRQPWSTAESARDTAALGYTSSTYDVANGTVYDADVEINTAAIKGRFRADEWPAVLLYLATHEAGHYLGLAHSEELRAVMYARHSDDSLTMHSGLTQDDINGICALYPPDPGLQCSQAGYTEAALTDTGCADAEAQLSEESETSCGVLLPGAPASSGHAWVVTLLAMGWIVARRRGPQS